eukprot:403374879
MYIQIKNQNDGFYTTWQNNDQLRKTRNLKHGCYVILINLITYDIRYYSRKDQLIFFQKIKDKIIKEINGDINVAEFSIKIIEALFEIEKFRKEESFDDDSSEETVSSQDNDQPKVQQQNIEDGNQNLNSSNQNQDQPETDDFLPQVQAFFGIENQIDFLKNKLENLNILELQDPHQRVDILLISYILGEVVINNNTMEEPCMIFIKQNFNMLINLLTQTKDIFTNGLFQEQSKDMQDFIVIFLEGLTYLFLDIFLNQANPELYESDGEIVSQENIQEVLKISKEILNSLISDQIWGQQGFEEAYEILPSQICKLISYSATILGMHHPEGNVDRIQEGGQLVMRYLGKLLKPYQDSKTRLNFNKFQKDSLSDIFDALDQVFLHSEFNVIQPLLNENLYESLITIFSLDTLEYENFSNPTTLKEFYQQQSGSNRKFYKEFAFNFVNDIMKHQQAVVPFLMYCVKQYHMYKSSKDEAGIERAAAALFILGLCDSTFLQNEKLVIANFLKKDLIQVVIDRNANKLLRFRAIWILETFIMFLDKSDAMIVLLYYGKVFSKGDDKIEEDELIKSAMAMAIFKFLSETDQQLEEEDKVFDEEHLKTNLNMSAQDLYELFIDYTIKYPELFEFPNAIQNVLIIFHSNLKFNTELIEKSLDALIKGFSLIIAKLTLLLDLNQAEDTEEYVEYMQTISTIVQRALYICILAPEHEKTLSPILKKYFKLFLAAGFHNPGPKLMKVVKSFFMFFARTKTMFMNELDQDQLSSSFQQEEKEISGKEKESGLNEVIDDISDQDSESELEEEPKQVKLPKKQIQKQSKKSQNSYSPGQISDTELLRFMLLNTIYTFNQTEKLKIFEERIAKGKKLSNQNENSSDEDIGGGDEEDFQDLIVGFDDDAHLLNFILYHCKCQLPLLFKHKPKFDKVSGKQIDEEEEEKSSLLDDYVKNSQNEEEKKSYEIEASDEQYTQEMVDTCLLSIHKIMRLYTMTLNAQGEFDLQNRMSYWLVMALIIENELITDIDEEYMSWYDQEQLKMATTQKSDLDLNLDFIAVDDKQKLGDPFFLFDEALKLLCKYLKKLIVFPQDMIQLFYLYQTSLFYMYSADTAYETIMKSFGEQIQMCKMPFIIDYTSKFESNPNPIFDDSTGYLLKYMRGSIWHIRALHELLNFDKTKADTKSFITQNLTSLSIIGKRLVSSYFQKEKPLKENPHIMKQIQKAQVEFISELAEAQEEEDLVDDVLSYGMQLYYVCWKSQLVPQEIIKEVIEFYEEIQDYPTTTTNNLSQQVIQTVQANFKKIVNDLKQIQKKYYKMESHVNKKNIKLLHDDVLSDDDDDDVEDKMNDKDKDQNQVNNQDKKIKHQPSLSSSSSCSSIGENIYEQQDDDDGSQKNDSDEEDDDNDD